MDKKVKWGIITLIGAGLIGWGIYSQLPKANEELAAADKVMAGKQINKRVLNVNAKIIKPQLLTDQIQISGSLMPDEKWIFLSRLLERSLKSTLTKAVP